MIIYWTYYKWLCFFKSWLLLICLNLLRFPTLDTCRSLLRAQGYIWPHLYCVYPCCVLESSRVTARWRLLVRERVEDLGSAGGITKWPNFFWPEPNKCSHQINVIHLSCRLQLIVWYPLIVVPNFTGVPLRKSGGVIGRWSTRDWQILKWKNISLTQCHIKFLSMLIADWSLLGQSTSRLHFDVASGVRFPCLNFSSAIFLKWQCPVFATRFVIHIIMASGK